MKIPFKLEYDGKTEIVNAGPLAIVQYERKSKKAISTWSSNVSFEDLALLAYFQLKIEKKVTVEFDDWLATLENLQEVEEQAPLAAGTGEA
jgi:hypothetical protein